jgi:hypothetical protein
MTVTTTTKHNGIRCLRCKSEIASFIDRHHYVACECGNCAIDGGLERTRILGDNYEVVPGIVRNKDGKITWEKTTLSPVYFQIQYEGTEGSVHSDGCTPIKHDFGGEGTFRDFAHALLDEFLDAYERGEVESPQDRHLLDGSHVVFGVCTAHNHKGT